MSALKPKRQVVLAISVTDLDYREGGRITEIAAVEIVAGHITDHRKHWYLNPDRAIDAHCMERYGLSNEFLADKPKFRDIADEFAELLQGAEFVVHNAPFAEGFIDHELTLIGGKSIGQLCISTIDTLRMFSEMRPGKTNSLNALCEEYGINVSRNDLPGSLLDAYRLAEVFLAATRKLRP